MKNLVKKLTVGLSLLMFAGMSFAQGGPEITLDKETHDYGSVTTAHDGNSVFTITNTGDKPLILSNARASCNCTVPQWPKEPISPGASAEIKVNYNMKRVGPINKSITITSNAVNSPTKVIRIKGTVKAAPTLEKKEGPRSN